jgi:phosphoribosylanthranilate isomerase
MTWVKICGTTNLADALVAVEAGADAVGFVFYEKSPRNVTPAAAREIVDKLPMNVEKVGVFVNLPVGEADKVLRDVGLTIAQVYSGSMEEWCGWYEASDRKLIWAVPGESLKGEIAGIHLGKTEKRFSAIIVDSGSGDRPGGTGKRFDWEGTKAPIWLFGTQIPIVIAGGLTPTNVGEAIKMFRPWGVDVASGVEIKPGKKDPEKVRAFVRAVRTAERPV